MDVRNKERRRHDDTLSLLASLPPFASAPPSLFLHSHMSAAATIIRVSVSEASRLFGVSTRTVRRAIADGELTYVVVRGRYKINFESLVKWSQRRPHVKNKLERQGIGQFVDQWKIKNRLYSPNPKVLQKER